MPGIFVSTKLYGKSTEDDPVYVHPVHSSKSNPKNILKVKLDEQRKINDHNFVLEGSPTAYELPLNDGRSMSHVRQYGGGGGVMRGPRRLKTAERGMLENKYDVYNLDVT